MTKQERDGRIRLLVENAMRLGAGLISYIDSDIPGVKTAGREAAEAATKSLSVSIIDLANIEIDNPTREEADHDSRQT